MVKCSALRDARSVGQKNKLGQRVERVLFQIKMGRGALNTPRDPSEEAVLRMFGE